MRYNKAGILLGLLLALCSMGIKAGDASKSKVKIVVVDTQGKPVSGAVVSNDKEKSRVNTNILGEFSIAVQPDEIVRIDADGYISQMVTVSAEMQKVVLTKTDRGAVAVAFNKLDKKDLLGGVSTLDVQELLNKNYFSYSLDNLSAYINGFSGNVWGMDSYLVLVDGVPRDASNVSPTEIDQISVLKGVEAVALYGSRAAKGAVLITTKRGLNKEQQVKIRTNSGIYVPKSYPEYLGSAEYMTLYNEARSNDGLTPLYDNATIYNYASGKNPYRYPSVDYYSSDYLKSFYNRTDATAEISGGNERTKFYTNIGFQHANSLLDVGQSKHDNNTRFNLRGNIDVKLTDFISSHVDASASYYDTRNAYGSYWAKAATTRPNRFSPLIPVSYLEESDAASWLLVNNSQNLIDGKYLLGGTQLDQTNPFADMYAAGYNKYTSRQFQFDATIDFNLSKMLKGLSFSTQMAIDYSDSYNESFNNTYAVYQAAWNNYSGNDLITSLTKYNEDKKSGTQNLSGSWQRQTIFFSGQFNYKNTFNERHNVSAIGVVHGYQLQESAVYHRTSNANLGLQASYNYDHRYYVDFTGAVAHSAKLPEGKRNGFSPTATIGWRPTQESFFPKTDVLNDLKLTASAGIVQTDLDISDYYLYEGVYTQSNGTWWGWKDGITVQSTNALRGENKDLTFAKRKEINIGLDALMFHKTISVNANYYNSSMNGIVTQASNLYPSYLYTYYPTSSFLPYINYNNDKRTGFDVNVNYNTVVGKTNLSVGLVASYYETKAARRSENYEYAYQNRTGKPLDAIWGLQSEGFFQSNEDIAAHATQSYGTVKPGDIKYKDQNNDGVIDSKDEVYLGRGGWYGSPLTLGANLTVKWNHFSLFTLATGGFGSYGMKNSSYYWVYGDSKYSAIVRNRWTEATKETATYPRLTTLSGDNNFRTSDFWMYKNDRINIAKVQLSYDIPASVLSGTFIRSLGLYISGSDLLTISKERKHMEMNVGSSPQCRFYNVGLKAEF